MEASRGGLHRPHQGPHRDLLDRIRLRLRRPISRLGQDPIRRRVRLRPRPPGLLRRLEVSEVGGGRERGQVGRGHEVRAVA